MTRALTAGCAVVAATALALLRFELSSHGWRAELAGVIAVIMAGYGTACGGLFGARVRGVKRRLLSVHLEDRIGVLEDDPIRDPITRWLERDRLNPKGVVTRFSSFVLGFYPTAADDKALTLKQYIREIEGSETRAVAGLVFGSIALFVSFSFVIAGVFR
ncbi:hypothetical protein [Jannaschia sp. M317]|uniref:hypothetical protein n=1 Tax=Jannaschia sp. M317 TaxID=2867011 RepID=UPI0021A6ACED|nr:hypothetical protein [Jannaschia sp. M317]UWQ16115.1 hypothetical protein K3551_09175 [Jannaschia sp. M317]